MSAPLLTPSERLALSRERLRTALLRDAQTQTPLVASLLGGAGAMQILKSVLPGAGEAMDALAAWWKQAPLRPFAQRHPVALVTGAVAVGVLVAWTRPWRWLVRPALLNTLAPALLTSLLASEQVQSWIQAMLAKKTAPGAPEEPQDAA